MEYTLGVEIEGQTEAEALEEILSAAGEEDAISLEEFLRREEGEA